MVLQTSGLKEVTDMILLNSEITIKFSVMIVSLFILTFFLISQDGLFIYLLKIGIVLFI